MSQNIFERNIPVWAPYKRGPKNNSQIMSGHSVLARKFYNVQKMVKKDF